MNNNDFYISEIPDDIFEKMQGKSYKENCTVPREELRYIHILHIGFDSKTHEGEVIVKQMQCLIYLLSYIRQSTE